LEDISKEDGFELFVDGIWVFGVSTSLYQLQNSYRNAKRAGLKWKSFFEIWALKKLKSQKRLQRKAGISRPKIP
jgi:hypothetical protein